MRESQLDRAREQKQVIAIEPSIAGHQLAAGLFLVRDGAGDTSRITVQDPPSVTPLIRLQSSTIAEAAADRLTAARSFGLAGFTEVADELALVETKEGALHRLLSESERIRGLSPEGERAAVAFEELKSNRTSFLFEGSQFVGRQFSIELALPAVGDGPRRVTVQHGLNASYLETLRSRTAASFKEYIDSTAGGFIGNGVIVQSGKENVFVKVGSLSLSRIFLD